MRFGIFISTICATLPRRGLVIVEPALLRSLKIMGWSDIRMAMRYTHAIGDGIRRAMQLLTQTGVGNGKVVQLQSWTDTKIHIKRERAACAARKCLI